MKKLFYLNLLPKTFRFPGVFQCRIIILLGFILLADVAFSQTMKKREPSLFFRNSNNWRIQYASAARGYFRVKPHGKGDLGFDLSEGVSHYKGQITSLGFSYFLSDVLYVKANFYQATDHYYSLSHSSMGFDGTVAFTLLNWRNWMFLNAIGGVTMASDKFPSSIDMETKTSSQAKYGIFGGGEIEVVLNHRISLLFNANERSFMGGKKVEDYVVFGTHRWYATIGLRYHLFSDANQKPSTANKFR